jgi:hypothetical protein
VQGLHELERRTSSDSWLGVLVSCWACDLGLHTTILTGLHAVGTPAGGVIDERNAMTIGEYRVGIPFNPLSNPIVDDIKRRAADLIDLCESMRKETGDPETDAERNRLISIAQTHFEDAAMWAVKAVTKGPRDT